MRWKIICSYLGHLLKFLGFSLTIPLLVSVYYGESDTYPFIATVAICVSIGLILGKSYDVEQEISFREGFAVVTLGWVVAAAVGAIPFYLAGTFENYIDAYFEAMSGFTTTGASVLVDVESQPHGILFWRSMTHWLGGMGIILLFIAVMPQLGIGALQLFKAEVPGPIKERIVPRIRDNAKILWYIYVGISAVEVIALLAAGMNFFDAVNHTFATMATGGFSTKTLSVGYYNSAVIDGIITFFMLVAGANFSLYYLLLTGYFRDFYRDSELRAYILIVFIATAIITLNLYHTQYDNIFSAFRYAIFQVVSIVTTTGFATTDFNHWPTLSKMIIFMLMFVGGCAGSTAGSIKVSRILVLLKQGIRELNRFIHPRAIVTLRVGDKSVNYGTLINVLQFFFIYIFMFAIGVLIMSAFNLDMQTSFSAVAATLGNVGPGFGSVGPMYSYAHIAPLGKVFLSFCMLLGRLELYTVLVLFLPRFWRE